MASDRRDSNSKVLNDAEEVQQKIIETIDKIRRQVEEDESISAATLEELQRQSQQIDVIQKEVAVVGAKLAQSNSLLNEFDKWAGNWSGGRKREALKEAAADVAARKESPDKIKEFYEQEKIGTLSRVWQPAGFVLSNLSPVPALFDPASIASQDGESDWSVDYSIKDIDGEGWTYASDFDSLNKKGSGDAKAAWTSCVRRRKWQKKFSKASLQGVRERNNTAKCSASSEEKTASGVYVPRNQVHPVAEGGGKRIADQEVDGDSAARLAKLSLNDKEIDDGLHQIDGIVDTLIGKASSINAELKVQAEKIDNIESEMDHTIEKEIVVNTRLKKLLSPPNKLFSPPNSINLPWSFTLESQIRKAARSTSNLFTSSDKSIPLSLILRSKGLAYLTVFKGGCLVGGKVGSGLVIGKLPDGSWSAPSAIYTTGILGGALIGVGFTDHVIILNTDEAVRAFSGVGLLSIGADIAVSVGPVGRDASANLNLGDGGIAPAFSYSLSKGVYAGVSLEGSVIRSRSDLNDKFYGRSVDPMELIQGNVPRPVGAQPLYDALDKAVTHSSNPS